MENPPVNDQPDTTQPLNQPDTGILRELGGRGGWRFWWPFAVWALDALMLFLFRPDTVGEPSGVLLIASLVAVILIWVMGARQAIQHGHNKVLVRMRAAVASLAVSAGAAILTMVARVVEATIVGADKARVFITTETEDPTVWVGTAEYSYLYYTLPVLVVLILIAWYLVGLGRAKHQA